MFDDFDPRDRDDDVRDRDMPWVELGRGHGFDREEETCATGMRTSAIVIRLKKAGKGRG